MRSWKEYARLALAAAAVSFVVCAPVYAFLGKAGHFSGTPTMVGTLYLAVVCLLFGGIVAFPLAIRRHSGIDDHHPKYRGVRVTVWGGIIGFAGFLTVVWVHKPSGFALLIVGWSVMVVGMVILFDTLFCDTSSDT